MINKKILNLNLFLSALLLCCISTGLWADENEHIPKWTYVAESCSACDFEVDVEVVDSYCDFGNGSISLDVSGGAAPYSYEWSTGETTSSINNLADADYFVTITDANGCSEVLEIDIDDDSSNVDANIYPENTSCGLTNGSISSNVSGGIAPYVFAWEDGFVGPERTDLSAGTYCVTVTDALGCTDDLCATVEEGSGTLGAVITSTPTECGEADGTISVSTYGGNPPYEYDWSNGDDEANLNNLPAGEFELTITDDDNCEVIYNVVIEDDCDPQECEDPVIASILIIEPHCNESDGQVSINMGSTGSYSYTWSPNVSSNNIATGIASDTYHVTIVDNTDPTCFITETFTVGTIDGPQTDLVTTDADCGVANGTATFTPDAYTYMWSDGGPNTSTRDDLTAGNYQVTIIDPANPDCQDIVTVMIGENPTLDYEVIVNQLPDCNASNGSVTIEVGGGSGNYTYSWGNSNTQTNLPSGIYCVDIEDASTGCSVTACFSLNDNVEQVSIDIDNLGNIEVDCPGDANGEVSYTINNMNAATPITVTIEDLNGNEYEANELPAGFFCVLATDANGCAAGSACFDVIEPDHLDVDIAVTDVTCTIDGVVELLYIAGGTAPYNIAWSNGSSNTSIGSLAPGNYSFTLTDAKGCSLSETVTVDDNAIDCDDCEEPVIASVIIVETPCNASLGQATINMAVPGTYTYQWMPNVSAINTASGLASGVYTVTITDLADPDCPLVEVFTLGTIDGPEANVVTTNATCGSMNGTATFTPSNFTYDWNVGDDLAVRTDLAAGTYQVIITDPADPDCQDIMTVVIGEDPSLDYEVLINQLPDCNESNGSVTINVSGGSGDYSYDWGASNTQTNLASGVYCVEIVDNTNGCNVTACFSLNDNVPLATIEIEATLVQVSCPGSTDGTVQFTVDPGAAAQPISTIIVDSDNNEYTNGMLPPGTYCIFVTDANGCAAGSECFEVIDPEQLDVDIAITPVTCEFPGNIDLLFITGGTAPYDISWSTSAGGPSLPNLVAGNYSFTLTDALGCSITENLNVSDQALNCDCAPPVITSVVVLETLCGEENGSATVNIAQNPANYSFEWDCGTCSAGQTLTGVAAGTYEVIITDLTDPTCSLVETFTIGTINGPEPTQTLITPATCNDSDGAVFLTPDTYMYAWSDGGAGWSRTDLLAGEYQVTVSDGVDSLCTDVITIIVGQNNPLELAVNITVLPDCQTANGQATIEVINGGSGDYTFSWGAATQNGLASGTYVVTVTDNITGCVQSISFVLNDNVPTASVDIENENLITSCPGASDATVVYTVTPSPGFNGDPIVLILDTNGFPVEEEDLGPGEYCILVRDAAGCLAGSACFEVTDPSQIDVDIAVVDAGCDTEGYIELSNIEVGTAPYTIVWPTILPAPSNPEYITNVQQGVYNFVLTDANGCAVSESVTVEGVTAPSNPMLTDIVSCEETIFLNVDSPGNVISWYNCDGTPAGPNPVEVTVSDTSCYYVEIANSFGCVVKDSIQVIEAPLPMANFTSALSPCSDTAFVQFMDASTSTDGGMITSWDWVFTNGTSMEQNPGVTVLEEGEFVASLTVTNDFGCTDTYIDTMQISILNNIAPPEEITICPGEEADLFPGADPMLTYSWSPSDSLSDATAPNPTSMVTSNTTYNVTITSEDGFCEVVRVVELSFTPMLTIDFDHDDMVICESGNVDLSGSTNGTDICWYSDSEIVLMNLLDCGTDISVPGLPASSPYYYAVAEDANGCTIIDSISVADYSIGVSFEPLSDLCVGDSMYIDPLYTLASDVAHEYMWAPNGMDIDAILVNPEETTIYDITVSNEFCETTESFEIVVRDVSEEALLSADPDTIFLGQTSQLEAVLDNGSTYEWSNIETLSFNDLDGPSMPTAAPLETTDYVVKITDELGCAGEATTRITVIDECDEPYIFFPNAFSPNDDGHNDVLYLRGFNADEVHFVIYNRWGEKLFESNNQNNGWDGSYKGERLCSDVYGFYLRVRCRNGEEYVKKGNVTLFR